MLKEVRKDEVKKRQKKNLLIHFFFLSFSSSYKKESMSCCNKRDLSEADTSDCANLPIYQSIVAKLQEKLLNAETCCGDKKTIALIRCTIKKYNRRIASLEAICPVIPLDIPCSSCYFVYPHWRTLVQNVIVSPGADPFASTSFTPQQIQAAYRLNNVTTPGNKPRGTGIKIGIVIAYYYPNLQTDYNTYAAQYGLPAKTLQIINFAGTQTNTGWALEACLDVQMAITAAPGATVLVVFAKSNNFADLFRAVQACINNKASVVNMSFGGNEFQGEDFYESQFSNDNIAFIASSGDSAAEVEFPSCLQNILSVGGTTLNLNGSTYTQTTWDQAGCSQSQYITRPPYQTLLRNTNSIIPGTKRITPDLSAIANPSSGFIVYCTAYNGYVSVGGTSAAAPLITGIIATANQKRRAVGKKFLTTKTGIPLGQGGIQTYMYPKLYNNNANSSVYKANFYDVVSGSDGQYIASPGYDCTGLGAPFADRFCNSLLNA
jgi:subtilase family serine protease